MRKILFLMTFLLFWLVSGVGYAQDSINVTLDWIDIKKHLMGNNPTDCLTNSNNYCTASNASHYNLARLGKQLVVLNYSNDSNPGSTSTYGSNCLNALNYYGYTCTDFLDYSAGDAKEPLDREHIVFINGLSYTEQGLIGHSFIIDGYEKVSTIKMYTTGEPSQILSELYYNHINWGWNGDCNGYFLDNIFDTSNANYYDSSANNNNAISIDFNYNVQYSEVYH